MIRIIAMPLSVCSLADERDDLCLDGHIERGRGLVGDEKLRLVRQRHGDHDALTHPPDISCG